MRRLILILALVSFVTNMATPVPANHNYITGTWQLQGIGNSLMEGYNATDRPTQNSLKKAYNKLSLNYPSNFVSYGNYGISGAGYASIASQLTTAIAAKDGSNYHAILIEGGVNEIGTGMSAATAYAALKAIVADAQAAYDLVIVENIAAYNYPTYNPATTNAVRLALNTLIRNGVTSGDLAANILVDIGNDVYFGTWESGGQNLTYYASDEIHWTVEGHRYVGEELIYTAIVSYMPSGVMGVLSSISNKFRKTTKRAA
jgi:lysophospholipase L1-like esterase